MDADAKHRDPKSLRTRAALEKTMLHLLKLLDHPEYSFGKLHKFQWDRYRGIRQDLNTQASQEGPNVVELHPLLPVHPSNDFGWIRLPLREYVTSLQLGASSRPSATRSSASTSSAEPRCVPRCSTP